LARRFRASFCATLRVALLDREGRARLSERTLGRHVPGILIAVRIALKKLLLRQAVTLNNSWPRALPVQWAIASVRRAQRNSVPEVAKSLCQVGKAFAKVMHYRRRNLDSECDCFHDGENRYSGGES
jgi:hypothetical protein